jgi:putative Mn2+ efflux pump MntP
LAGLPLSLSFDNLAAGVGLGSLGFPVIASALIIGLVSGSLCAVGLFAGAQLRRWMPERAELWSGVYLLALAAVRLLEAA